jgi:sarcosine oxidase subunit gamma
MADLSTAQADALPTTRLPADLSAARQQPALVASAFVRRLPPAARFSLRGQTPVMSAAGTALGLNISDVACRSATNGSRSALWLGPDEQLVSTTVADGPMVTEQLQAALQGQPHSLVDISHRQFAFEVTGNEAHTALNGGCPLDLDLAAFPVGMCTRTILGKADIVLWRTGDHTFHVEVWRSFADYVSRFLAECSRDLAG